MMLHDISLIGIALAMASMIFMAAATTPHSTDIEILFPGLHEMDLNNVEGSVMSADAMATTIQIDCRSSATKQCTSSGYLLPQTLTAGPSFQDFHYDITSFWNNTIFIVTGTLDCNMTGSTLGASCYFSTSTWVSSGTKNISSVFATTASISSANLKYNTLAVPSGLENFPVETAATNASPGHTGTSTSKPTTTAVTTLEHHSSSKAWIAGPVIGAVAGLALATVAGFWFISRRHKSKAGPVYWDPTQGISEVSENHACLPAQNAPVSELSARSPPADLSTPSKPHEMG
ncbi:hypothetical protein PEX1_105440 [Penicillium expansum]|uniref:Uncharacterized protein n=1 Tax=Penicillium expansum TaxID=27334 RepID=A0A0A2JAS5_PENEN|nr:hypothetical protein PEX2_051430 [Penicillium expansum]KGO45975.1 hypothetical protein PEX1_105440 [Penicillium expansum]KGO49445.1 hypothetical protein PEX2_051430 [Penicillium expansum]